MPGKEIPDSAIEAIARHIAVVGKTGVGKRICSLWIYAMIR